MSPRDAKEAEANTGYLGDVENGLSSAASTGTCEVDPWAIVELVDDSLKWSGMCLFMSANFCVLARVLQLFKCKLLAKKKLISSS
jgi:hypothetical protein